MSKTSRVRKTVEKYQFVEFRLLGTKKEGGHRKNSTFVVVIVVIIMTTRLKTILAKKSVKSETLMRVANLESNELQFFLKMSPLGRSFSSKLA